MKKSNYQSYLEVINGAFDIVKKGFLGFLAFGVVFLLEIIAIIVIFSLIAYYILGSGFQGDLISSLNTSDYGVHFAAHWESISISMSLLVFIFITSILAVITQYFIALTLYISYLGGVKITKSKNLIQIFFVESWKFMIDAIKVLSSFTWFVLWPFLLVSGIFVSIDYFIGYAVSPNLAVLVIATISIVSAFFYSLYRLYISYPTWYVFICEKKRQSSGVVERTIKFTKGHKLLLLMLIITAIMTSVTFDLFWSFLQNTKDLAFLGSDDFSLEQLNSSQTSSLYYYFFLSIISFLLNVAIITPFTDSLSFLLVSKNYKK